jgi:hypothetical protein
MDAMGRRFAAGPFHSRGNLRNQQTLGRNTPGSLHAGERILRAPWSRRRHLAYCFESALQSWSAGHVKLIAACLFYAKRERLYRIESLTLMMASEEWIPWIMPTKSRSSKACP